MVRTFSEREAGIKGQNRELHIRCFAVFAKGGLTVSAERERKTAPRSVPPGWAPIATACSRFEADLAEFADRCARVQVAEIEEASRFDFAWLRRGTELFVASALKGMAERRPPTEPEKQLAFESGRAAARIGVTSDTLVRALQVALREYLKELSRHVAPRSKGLLLEAITTVWSWLLETSDAAVKGYAFEASEQDAMIARTRERFVDALKHGNIASDEARAMALTLGFDITDLFRAYRIRTRDGDTLRSILSHERGVIQVSFRGSDGIVVSQNADADAIVAVLKRVVPDGPIGIGMSRPGLEGAYRSLVDAELAVSLSETTHDVVHFERDWVAAILCTYREHLDPLLNRGVATCREAPHIVEAVLAFESSGFRLTEGARKLHLKPNSFSYRLRRWQDLTDQDTSSLNGLAYATLASISAKAEATENGLPGPT